MEKTHALRYRIAPLEMSPGEFRKASYRLIDQVAVLRVITVERVHQKALARTLAVTISRRIYGNMREKRAKTNTYHYEFGLWP